MKYSASKAVKMAAVLSGLAIAAYGGWFFVINDMPLSTSTSDWGQFGSYMAGTAGVSFALATVWMLAETLRLQTTELELTKEELKRSSDALEKQVNLSIESSRSEKHYYIVKTIDENIDSIKKQHLYHNETQKTVGSLSHSADHFEIGQYQLEQIADQYMHLMYVAENAETLNATNNVLDLAQPMVYKNKAMLLKLYESGYFNQYERSVKNLGFSQVFFKNLEYEIDEIEKTRE